MTGIWATQWQCGWKERISSGDGLGEDSGNGRHHLLRPAHFSKCDVTGSNYVRNYEVLYNAFYEALSNFAEEKSVKFSGKVNMLKQPEFDKVDDVKNIISKFESKDIVSKIEESDNEVKVYIGSESEIDDSVTVVKTKYKVDGREGTIAIIGPKRMEYERVINMLEYLKSHIEAKGKDE